MAAALTAASVVICWGASKVLEHQLDQALAAAAFFSGELMAHAGPLAPEVVVPADTEYYARDVNRYVVLRDPQGRVGSAIPASAADLPLDTAALARALHGSRTWGTAAWHGGEVRTLYTLLTGPPHGPRVVEVAASLEPIGRVRRELAGGLAIVVFLGTVATFLGVAMLARTAIRPVGEITASAKHIEAGTLDQRIAAHARTEEYQELVAVLNRMLNRLETAFRTQRRLTTDVSHELRTPLTALRGEIEVALRAERSPDDYCRVLRSALEEIDSMIELTAELLFVTRAEAHLLTPQREDTEVDELIREVLDRLRDSAQVKGLRIDVSLAALRAFVDPEMFRSLVARLLDNAVKFAPEGGTVRVGTLPLDGGFRLSVENSGGGIAAADLPHLFDPLYRADPARTRGSGAGLGLTLAAAVTRLHGGTIEASNVAGGGARFQVDFPGSTRS